MLLRTAAAAANETIAGSMDMEYSRSVLRSQQEALHSLVETMNYAILRFRDGHDGERSAEALLAALENYERTTRIRPFDRDGEPVQTTPARDDCRINCHTHRRLIEDPFHPVTGYGEALGGFDKVHVSVPLRQDVYTGTQHLSENDLPSFVVYSNAMMLSMNEIRRAQQYHLDARDVDHEEGACPIPGLEHDYFHESSDEEGTDQDEAHARATRSFELLRMGIQSEFLQLVRPVITACVTYNIALICELDSRTNTTADSMRRIRSGRRAYETYRVTLTMLKPATRRCCVTANLLGIAATNNRALMLIEQRYTRHAHAHAQQHMTRAMFMSMIGMVHHRERCFPASQVDKRTEASTANGEVVVSHDERRLLDTIRSNAIDWLAYDRRLWMPSRHASVA